MKIEIINKSGTKELINASHLEIDGMPLSGFIKKLVDVENEVKKLKAEKVKQDKELEQLWLSLR